MRINNNQTENSASLEKQVELPSQTENSTPKAEVPSAQLSTQQAQNRSSQAGERSRLDFNGASLRNLIDQQLGLPTQSTSTLPEIPQTDVKTTDLDQTKALEDKRFEPPFLTDPEAVLHGIANFAEIRPDVFRSGAPMTAESFKWLKENKGVELEVDLRMPDEVPQTAKWAAAVGISSVSIPMDGYTAPTSEQVDQLFKAIPPYNPDVTSKILIHDAAGQHRMGMMAALLRVREGIEPDKAIKEMIGRGFQPVNVKPNGPAGLDIIDYIKKFGDTYQSLKISPNSQQEPEFITFFTTFWNENRSIPRAEFGGAIQAALEKNSAVNEPTDI